MVKQKKVALFLPRLRQHGSTRHRGANVGLGIQMVFFVCSLLVFLSHGVCKSPYISLPACMHMALQGHCPFPQQQPSHGQERGARERCCLTTTASSAALFLPPSTHRPCDESHTQKLRKGLRSAGTEKRSVCGLPPDPGSKCWWSPAGSCPRPCPCLLLPAQTFAKCARQGALRPQGSPLRGPRVSITVQQVWPANRQGALRPQGCPLRGPLVSITSQRPHTLVCRPPAHNACFALCGCSGNNSAPNAPSTSISSPSPETAATSGANSSDATSAAP